MSPKPVIIVRGPNILWPSSGEPWMIFADKRRISPDVFVTSGSGWIMYKALFVLRALLPLLLAVACRLLCQCRRALSSRPLCQCFIAFKITAPSAWGAMSKVQCTTRSIGTLRINKVIIFQLRTNTCLIYQCLISFCVTPFFSST